jgi:catechol 2,3-dioxygenase-like lactoylglutathione lyase family enzyme
MQAIHHVGLTVSNLERSIRFYRDVLGLPFWIAPTSWITGEHLAQALGVAPPASLRVALFKVGDGETLLELLEYESPPSTTRAALDQNNVGAAHIAFRVPDIMARVTELAEKGVQFNSDINVVDDGPLAGWRWVYFRDPDGHTLELVEIAYVNEQDRLERLAAYAPKLI